MVRFNELWLSHPGKNEYPCNEDLFLNQCAIRMSVALYLANINVNTFNGTKCWGKHKDIYKYKLKSYEIKPEDVFTTRPLFKSLNKGANQFRHFLRAQEIADWMDSHPEIFGKKIVFKRKDDPLIDYKKFTRYKGIIFILDGWGYTDHIDVWNGYKMKGGSLDYLSLGKEIWLWELI